VESAAPGVALDPVSKRPGNPPVAVVIGADCITGLQTVRALHAHGIRVLGVAGDREHFALRSRCLARIEIVEWEAESLRACLRRLATPDRPVLIPATDTAVELVAKIGDELSTAFRVSNPTAHSIDRALRKIPFAKHADEHGVPTPRTRSVESLEGLRRAIDELSAPYVLKPDIKTPRWDELAGVKVFRAEDPADLLQTYERCRDWSDRFVVQEWVEGGDDSMYSYYAFVSQAGELVVDCVGHKIRQWPRWTGSGTLSEIFEDPEILAVGRALLESLEHRGFATINMKRDANSGRLFVLETNVGRPGMGMFVAEAAGIEMTHLAFCSLSGQPLPDERRVRFSKARWVSTKRDLAAAYVGWRRGELSVLDYSRSIRDVRRRADFDWRDPLPFLHDLRRAPAQIYRLRSGRLKD
jgi:predicted ATP-grasp superfamily ATP-dependent carboligase